MTILYVWSDWHFFSSRWATYIARGCDTLGTEEFAELIEVNPVTLKHWIGDLSVNEPNYPYPSMTNFLKVCSLLDIDPAIFFHVRDA